MTSSAADKNIKFFNEDPTYVAQRITKFLAQKIFGVVSNCVGKYFSIKQKEAPLYVRFLIHL